jgi:uroporphyrinogen-III synthase
VTRPVAVLRPEPGNSATAARLAERGLTAIRLPLFQVVGLAWDVPDPSAFDALIITSANTLRHGGNGLGVLKSLPVLAVGAATANAARTAGFDVVAVGEADAAALIAEAATRGIGRALHLGGREAMVAAGGVVARAIPVYASEAATIDAGQVAALSGSIALLHSARAARQLAMLIDQSGIDRHDIAIAAISPAVAATTGLGWARINVATSPNDPALIDCAVSMVGDSS